MTPDFRRIRNGLLLIAAQVGAGLLLGILVGFGVGRTTAPMPTCVCEYPAIVEVAECRVLLCEHEREVSVFVNTLRCALSERLVWGYDADGFETAKCEKKR